MLLHHLYYCILRLGSQYPFSQSFFSSTLLFRFFLFFFLFFCVDIDLHDVLCLPCSHREKHTQAIVVLCSPPLPLPLYSKIQQQLSVVTDGKRKTQLLFIYLLFFYVYLMLMTKTIEKTTINFNSFIISQRITETLRS